MPRDASVGRAAADVAVARMARTPIPATARRLPPNRRQRSAGVTPPVEMSVLLARGAAMMGLVITASASSHRAAPRQRVDQATSATAEALRIPAVGERLLYDVKFSAVKVGSGFMEAVGYEPVRGINTLHVRFVVRGGTFFYKVNDVLESWIDTAAFTSLRHKQDLSEGSRDRERNFEFFPERRVFSQDGRPEEAGVSNPLDDGSFLYFVRRVPLAVGQTYEFNRYFRPDRNPVRIIVLRKERIRVPSGQYNTIVIQPIIKAKGLFSEGGKAQVWLTDDSARVMVQMKSSLPIGSLNLYLREYRPAAGAALIRGN